MKTTTEPDDFGPMHVKLLCRCGADRIANVYPDTVLHCLECGNRLTGYDMQRYREREEANGSVG